MRCQRCGEESPDNHIYCQRCGAIIERAYRIDESRIRDSRERITRSIWARSHTDRVIPLFYYWLLILSLFLIVVVQFAVLFVGLGSNEPDTFWDFGTIGIVYAVTSLASFVLNIIFLFMFYLMIKRQNEHYSREWELRDAVISLVKDAAETPERFRIVEGDLMTMERADSVRERHRRTWFWIMGMALPYLVGPPIFISMLGGEDVFGSGSFTYMFIIWMIALVIASLISAIIQFVMLWFLGNSMTDHSVRWRSFSIATRNALSKLGFPQTRSFRVHSLPERNYVLYLILTLFTGIFVIYWVYALIKDPNEHFKYQWEFEDYLLGILGSRGQPITAITGPQY